MPVHERSKLQRIRPTRTQSRWMCGAVAATLLGWLTTQAQAIESVRPHALHVPPDANRTCFPGAVYRKAVSSRDRWTGIEGVLRLPEISFDPARAHPTRPGRPADNASIYLGGWAPVAGDPEGQEIDAGLTWEVIRLPDGRVSTQPQAYRPFWRHRAWFNANAHPDFYYYPGDVLRVRLEWVEPQTLELSVTLLERGEQARVLGAPQTPVPFSTRFEARGFSATGPQEFKRVNAIDQAGNEGRPTQATRTQVGPAVWREVWLLRGAQRWAFDSSRFTDMRCPTADHVVVKPQPGGGEIIELKGTP